MIRGVLETAIQSTFRAWCARWSTRECLVLRRAARYRSGRLPPDRGIQVRPRHRTNPRLHRLDPDSAIGRRLGSARLLWNGRSRPFRYRRLSRQALFRALRRRDHAVGHRRRRAIHRQSYGTNHQQQQTSTSTFRSGDGPRDHHTAASEPERRSLMPARSRRRTCRRRSPISPHEALKNSINIPPTIHVDQGTRIIVFVRRDLDFSALYPDPVKEALRDSSVNAPARSPDSLH